MQYLTITLIIIISLMLVLMLLTLFFSFFLTSAVIRPPRRSHKTALNYHIKNNGVAPDYLANLKKTDWQFISSTGDKLEGMWIEPEEPDGRYIIMVHGHGHNMMGSLKYIPLFLEKGFRILIYDQIHSGISEGRFTTMGHIESQDLCRIIDSIHKTESRPVVLGLLGESMGAATVIMAACHNKKPDFVIADCSFADLEEQLIYRLKFAYRLGRIPLVPVGSLISRLRAGFYWRQVSPVREIEKMNGLPDTPILFAHGLADTYIPPAASEKLYSVKKGYSELLLVDGARHAESVSKDRQAYSRAVNRLLNHVDKQFTQ